MYFQHTEYMNKYFYHKLPHGNIRFAQPCAD